MASNLPDYVASAQPVPRANRLAWYKSTAQTYAGIMLWFVFWHDVPSGNGALGGTLAQGLGVALLGLILAGLLCHFLYYLVPGLLGMQTGLPLYIVGTSTYGTLGGFLMPGFLMGLLQFGWLSVNAFFSSWLLVAPFFDSMEAAKLSPAHRIVATIWAIAAAFIGLKGIQYVAKVATFLPLIPLVILLVLSYKTFAGIADFEPQTAIAAGEAAAAAEASKAIAAGEATAVAEASRVVLSTRGVIEALLVFVIGFFATAGAAGTDFGMNNRDARDVQLGGLFGITGATIVAGGLSLAIVAGAYGAGLAGDSGSTQTTKLMAPIMGGTTGSVFMWLLAIAAIPPACFSAFIAANSFKTTLPQVSPTITVGIGTAVSIALAVTGLAGRVIDVFQVVGASFGPVCGAMAADYLLSGRKWAGPRSGFNLAGWISWLVGFAVGTANFIVRFAEGFPDSRFAEIVADQAGRVPVPPLSAFVVGFVLYWILAKVGLQSRTLEMPSTGEPSRG